MRMGLWHLPDRLLFDIAQSWRAVSTQGRGYHSMDSAPDRTFQSHTIDGNRRGLILPCPAQDHIFPESYCKCRPACNKPYCLGHQCATFQSHPERYHQIDLVRPQVCSFCRIHKIYCQ